MSTRGQSAGAAEAAAVTRAERTTLDRDRQAAVRAGRIDAWRADLRSELIASLCRRGLDAESAALDLDAHLAQLEDPVIGLETTVVLFRVADRLGVATEPAS